MCSPRFWQGLLFYTLCKKHFCSTLYGKRTGRVKKMFTEITDTSLENLPVKCYIYTQYGG